MADNDIKCSRCKGEMEAGCIMSPTKSPLGTLLAINMAEWYGGGPRAGFWGYSLPAQKFPITVYRCKKCGFLEAFAR